MWIYVQTWFPLVALTITHATFKYKLLDEAA